MPEPRRAPTRRSESETSSLPVPPHPSSHSFMRRQIGCSQKSAKMREREKSWRWHATDLAITALIREQVVV